MTDNKIKVSAADLKAERKAKAARFMKEGRVDGVDLTKIIGLPPHARVQLRPDGNLTVFYLYQGRVNSKRVADRDYIGTVDLDTGYFVPNEYYKRYQPTWENRPLENYKYPEMRAKAEEKRQSLTAAKKTQKVKTTKKAQVSSADLAERDAIPPHEEEKLKYEQLAIGFLQEDENGMESLTPHDHDFAPHGLPATKAKSVGRPRKVTSKQTDQALDDGAVLGFGFGITVMELAKKANLYGILEEALGAPDCQDVLAIGAYFAKGACGLSGLEHFTRRQMQFANTIVDAQRGLDVFRALEPHRQDRFFQLWVQHVAHEQVVCYDVSSIATPVFGSYRDDFILKSSNYGLFATLKEGIPLSVASYQGNIHDFTNYSGVLKHAMEIGIGSDFQLLLDGSAPADFSELQNTRFVIGAPSDICPGVRAALLKWRHNCQQSPVNSLIRRPSPKSDMAEVPFSLEETQGRLLMYYDDERAAEQQRMLKATIWTMVQALQTKTRLTEAAARQYQDYFNIQCQADGRFEYEPREDVAREDFALCGCMALFTNDPGISLDVGLQLYREKEAVGNFLVNVKEDVDGEELRVRSGQSARGKLFVLFIALIIRQLLYRATRDWIQANHSSLDAVIAMLEDIEVKKYDDRWILQRTLTPQQKDLAKILQLPIYQLDV